MIFVTKLRLHEERCSPAIIWLCLLFFSIFYYEISQKFHNLWKLSCWSIKSQKNRGYQHSFLAFCYFVFSSSISNLVLRIFLLTGTSKDTNMFNGPANLEILPKEKKSYSKDPYFLCQTTTIVKFATATWVGDVKIVYILNRHQQTFVYQPFNQQDKFIRGKDSTEGFDITQCIMSIKAFWKEVLG